MNEQKRVYLDWSAASPLLPEAKVAMEPYLTDLFANPSSIHQEGVASRKAVENARSEVARLLGVKSEFVTFTGGGTEGNNLAIIGLIEGLHSTGCEYKNMAVLTTEIEHPSILRTCESLAKKGVSIRYVKVNSVGMVDLVNLREQLDSKVVLVSMAYANSEIGVIQPLRTIRKLLREMESKTGSQIIFHVDGAQAPLWLPCQLEQLGADVLVIDAGKCCGPKGVGVLVRGKRSALSPIMFGGGQEQGIRSGTENVAGIVGAVVAVGWAQNAWRARAERTRMVRDQGIALLLEKVPGAVLNGPSGENRLANNINISIPGIDTEFLTIVLDSKGFAVSTKSACSGASGGESLVVKTTTGNPARATSTLRITLGPDTTIEDVEGLITAITDSVIQQQKHEVPAL